MDLELGLECVSKELADLPRQPNVRSMPVHVPARS